FVYGFTPVAAAPYVFLGNAAAPAHPCALSLHDALPILSAVAFWKTPITSDGREGFVELRLPGVVTFCPPSHMGYSRPNSDFTFFSASSMRLRFSGLEKSMNGSLVNSEMCGFCSAVATGNPPLAANKSLR